VDRVHESVHGAGPVHRGPAAIAAPVPESSDRGAGERESGPTNSMAGFPRLGRRWRGGSPATETSAWKDDGEGAVRARRGGVGGVRGGFYRAEVSWGRAERLQLPD
jgi:hypothetical protein